METPGQPGPPSEDAPGPPGSPNGGPPGPLGPPGGGSSGPTDDSGPTQLSFIWQSGSALDQSIADMNWSVIQLLTAQHAANVQLQLQMQQNQDVQIGQLSKGILTIYSPVYPYKMGLIKKNFSRG